MKLFLNIVAAIIIIGCSIVPAILQKQKPNLYRQKILLKKNGGKKQSFINSIQEVLKTVMVMASVISKESFQNWIILKSLGVTAVWLNPIYSSPNDDNGYDVSDYRSIMKDFGTMEDFDALLKGMHERDIKLVMDIVVNHSSDEHEWFKQSRSSRTSPYRNYYHWWNAERGKPPYRYSLFDVNHDAWKYDSLTNAYYFHYFSQKQPDLNWENPKLRQEIYDMMKFWAEKGVDGFRLDAFRFAAKDTTFPAFPKGFEKNFMQYYAMGLASA